MRTLRTCSVALAAFLTTLAGRAWGQASTSDGMPPTAAAPAAEQERAEPRWTLSAAAYVYFVPDSSDYVQPTVTDDHEWLHLEARYSYEDLLTGSAWFGYNLSGGDKVAWAITPMLGGVFGRTNGLAPGYKGALSFWKLELYSEGEYLFDLGDASESFFYAWSELSVAPVEWARLGLVTQRTRVHSSGRFLERGLLLGFSYAFATLTGYVFNPDDTAPVFVVALGVSLDL